MRRVVLPLLLAALLLWPILGLSQTVSPGSTFSNGVRLTNAIPVIVDQDYGCDADDAADLWLAAFLHRQGYIQLLGVGASGGIVNSAPGVRASLDSVSLQAVPVANGNGWSSTNCDFYATAVRDQFRAGDVNANYTNSTVAYRTWLAASRGGVAIIATGQAFALQDLLNSPADGISGLTGKQLIAAKVAALYWAAGVWPSGTGDFNLTCCNASNKTWAADVLANWTSPIILVNLTIGGITLTGDHLPQPANTTVSGFGCFSASSPVCSNQTTNPFHKAWASFDANSLSGGNGLDVNGMRNAWTQPELPALAFGLGAAGLTIAGANGTCSLNTGTLDNTWSASAGTCSYLAISGSSSHSAIQTALAAYFTGF